MHFIFLSLRSSLLVALQTVVLSALEAANQGPFDQSNALSLRQSVTATSPESHAEPFESQTHQFSLSVRRSKEVMTSRPLVLGFEQQRVKPFAPVAQDARPPAPTGLSAVEH